MSPKKKKFWLYKLESKISGSAYVGITCQSPSKRLNDHHWTSKDGTTPLYRAMRKYGLSNFSMNVLANAFSYEALCDLESIAFVQEKTHVSCGGYNVTFGGEGAPGWKPSLETKEKIRKASVKQMKDVRMREHLASCARAQWADPERRRRCIEGMLGKTISPEQREKLRTAMTGRFVSEETRAKLRACFLGKPRPKEICERLALLARGRKHTEASKAKMSAARKGIPKSEATKQKMREAWIRRRVQAVEEVVP